MTCMTGCCSPRKVGLLTERASSLQTFGIKLAA